MNFQISNFANMTTPARYIEGVLHLQRLECLCMQTWERMGFFDYAPT